MSTRINRVFSLAKLSSTPDNLYVVEFPVERKCIKCKNEFIPTKQDISTKRPSCYYKACSICRIRFNDWAKNNKVKKGEDKGV